jgi:serine/threonine protein kinase
MESAESSPWKYLPRELGECEDLENYEPGGFCPIHLGNVYDDRYRIVTKLGFGGFSIVWLARDPIMNRLVALKIVVARVAHVRSPIYDREPPQRRRVSSIYLAR